jgi:hypothetical protein
MIPHQGEMVEIQPSKMLHRGIPLEGAEAKAQIFLVTLAVAQNLVAGVAVLLR